MIKVHRYDRDSFIKRAKEIHGDKYCYDKVEYVNSKTKVCIICPIHGEFWQEPQNHLQGKGCIKCAHEYVVSLKRLNTEEFIKRAKSIHGDRYDYSLVKFKNNSTKVKIICPIHGIFEQRPSSHLYGMGCWKCGRCVTGLKNRSNQESFLEKAKSKYGDKFDYSLVHYKTATSKIKIICPKHGVFITTPNYFLSHYHGCPQCGKEISCEKKKLSDEEFIERAKEIHGNMFDYSLVEYSDYETPVKIICKKHGVFEQTPDHHLAGNGCPMCKESKGERRIRYFLEKNNIPFESQYKIDLEVLMFSRNNLKVDFYIPSMNAFIEFNGKQHYEKTPFFHKTEDDFLIQVDRDKRLKQYCKKNKIKLIVIKYNQIDNINGILTKKLNIK